MKAIQYGRFGGPEVLEYLDLPNPTPESGQLLIETVAIGVNFPDIRERLGVYNNAETRVGGAQLPQVGGLAVAGTVVKAGPQTSVPVGRKVVALMKEGAYAQLTVAEEPGSSSPMSLDDEIASSDWLLPSGVLRPARIDRKRAAIPRGRPQDRADHTVCG